MNAAHRGDVAMVQALADRGADLNHTAKYNLSALMLAVINNHAEVVRVLVTAGANRDIGGTKGQFARTPLQYAEQCGHAHLVALLRDGT